MCCTLLSCCCLPQVSRETWVKTQPNFSLPPPAFFHWTLIEDWIQDESAGITATASRRTTAARPGLLTATAATITRRRSSNCRLVHDDVRTWTAAGSRVTATLVYLLTDSRGLCCCCCCSSYACGVCCHLRNCVETSRTNECHSEAVEMWRNDVTGDREMKREGERLRERGAALHLM